ncbi:unnamed protein product [Penicillium bialowiezense]
MYIMLALSFASLALGHPSINSNNLHARDIVPYGAFPTPSSTESAIPSYTPPPPPRPRKLGHAIVNNNCDFTVYLWSVGTDVKPVHQLNSGESYDEMFREDPNTGGIAIKLSTDMDGLYTSAPQMVFAYNLSYFKRRGDNGEKVCLTPAEPSILWENGVPPAGSQVRVIASSTDLVLSLC